MMQYIIAFSVTLVLILLLRRHSARLGLVDIPSGRKKHRQPTSTAGGLAIFAGVAAGLLASDTRLDTEFQPLLLGGGLLLATGVVDDLRPLGSRFRLAIQALAALALTLWGGLVVENAGPLVGNQPLALGAWAVPFTVFGILGAINATNMIDGVDGLAGSLILVTLTAFTLLAALAGESTTVAILGIACAALLAFLCFNARLFGRTHAAIFMGDAGSMLLGFVIAWAIIKLSQSPANAVSPIAAIWLFALPLMDTVTIMTRRVLKGRSPFSADRSHLHHVLLRARLSVPQTVAVLSALSTLFAAWGIFGQLASLPDTVMFYSFCVVFILYYWASRRAWLIARLLRQAARQRRSASVAP